MIFGRNKKGEIENKYVAFCDVLGFSSAVISDFEATVALYKEFRLELKKRPNHGGATISLYSDSIFIVSKDLKYVLLAVNLLYIVALQHGWFIRGGVAFGKHWKESDRNNLFIVSEALVKAAAIEKTVKWPIIALAPDLDLGLEYWIPRFQYDVFIAPVLYYDGLTIVNPFNKYWFNSAYILVSEMLKKSPNHTDKYSWFLCLYDAVKRGDLLVPDAIVEELVAKKIIALNDASKVDEAEETS